LALLLSLHLEEIVKQRSIVRERGPKLLGITVSITIPKRDIMGCSIVLHHIRVVNGNVFGSLLEIAHRIATSLHYFTHQVVCFSSGIRGIVHKSSLRLTPTLGELIALRAGEWPNIELLYSLLPRFESFLGPSSITLRSNGVLIFGPKTLLKPLGLTLLHEKPDRDCSDHDEGYDKPDDDRIIHRLQTPFSNSFARGTSVSNEARSVPFPPARAARTH
jgi:hypothetical protein